MFEQNSKTIREKKKKYNYLLDTSTILYLLKIYEECEVSIFKLFKELPDAEYFVCNEVLSELISGKNGFKPTKLGIFLGHILNAESTMDPQWKENRFLIEEDGETRYVVLNKISATDYAQVLLCQNHVELTLVVNDRRMLRSGAQILKERIIGTPSFLEQLCLMEPNNPSVKLLKQTGDTLFEKKHAFGENKNKIQ